MLLEGEELANCNVLVSDFLSRKQMGLIHKLIIVVTDEGTNTTTLTAGVLGSIVGLAAIVGVIMAVAGFFYKRKTPGLIMILLL